MVPHCLWATNHRSDCHSHLLAENFVPHTHFSHNSNSPMTREKLTSPLTPRQQSDKHLYNFLHCISYRHKIKPNEERATRQGLQPGRGGAGIQQIWESLVPAPNEGSGNLNVPPLLSLPLFYCQNEPPKLFFNKPWAVLKPWFSSCFAISCSVGCLTPCAFADSALQHWPFLQELLQWELMKGSLCSGVASSHSKGFLTGFSCPSAGSILQLSAVSWGVGKQILPMGLWNRLENPGKFTHSSSSGQVIQFSNFLKLFLCKPKD